MINTCDICEKEGEGTHHPESYAMNCFICDKCDKENRKELTIRAEINSKKRCLEAHKIQLENAQSEDEEGEIKTWITHRNREIKELQNLPTLNNKP